ncbi:hypothetical protein RO602_12345, partial [Akkermansia muciniphila]
YLLFTEFLPDIAEAKQLGPFFLSKGGITLPAPVWVSGHLFALAGLIAGCVMAWFYRRWAQARFEATGQLRSMFWVPVVIVLA